MQCNNLRRKKDQSLDILSIKQIIAPSTILCMWLGCYNNARGLHSQSKYDHFQGIQGAYSIIVLTRTTTNNPTIEASGKTMVFGSWGLNSHQLHLISYIRFIFSALRLVSAPLLPIVSCGERRKRGVNYFIPFVTWTGTQLRGEVRNKDKDKDVL